MKQTVLTEGSGMKQRRKMIGRGFVTKDGRFNAPELAKADKYLKLGKYKENKE